MDYKEEWKYLRERIRALRLEKGMSIQALADYADIDRSSLSRIESGAASGIYLTTLCRIAEALEVAPGDLLRQS